MAHQAKPKVAKEPLMKEPTQCQYCFKSRLADGVSLSKCAGCKIALYCSKECQTAAWKTHKETCKLNQRQFSAPPVQISGMQRLRDFSSKHRATLAEYSIRALDLSLDPSRALRDIVLVQLKPRPNSKKAETAFMATSVSVEPADFLGPKQGRELRGQLENFDAQQKRIGMRGGFMVMLTDTESGAAYICPIGFGDEVMEVKPGRPWREEMMTRINTGIVC